MYRESQFSIHDYLSEIRPDLYKAINEHKEKHVSPDSAKVLYSLWSDVKNKVSNKVYNKPVGLSETALEGLQRDGLIQNHQGKLVITAKGSEVIRVMVLGDNRSCFEDDGSQIEYKVAKVSTESPTRLRKKSKTVEDDFWSSFSK